MLDEDLSYENSTDADGTFFTSERPLTSDERLNFYELRREAAERCDRVDSYQPIRSDYDHGEGPGLIYTLALMLIGAISWEFTKWGYQFLKGLLFTVLVVSVPDLLAAIQSAPGGC